MDMILALVGAEQGNKAYLCCFCEGVQGSATLPHIEAHALAGAGDGGGEPHEQFVEGLRPMSSMRSTTSAPASRVEKRGAQVEVHGLHFFAQAEKA